MNDPRLRAGLLTRLFRKGQADEKTSLIDLAAHSGASLTAVRAALAALERAGLVDAPRLRLTLFGLAFAAAFSEPASRSERSSARRAGRPPGRSPHRARHAA